MSKETWKTVPGYEGLYEVSTHGRVRSLDRTVMVRRKSKVHYRTRKGLILKQSSRSGYFAVDLSKNGKASKANVHRLVAVAFLGDPLNGLVVCHNNSNELDNRVENLRWDTPSSNSLDVIKAGNNYELNKTHCPRGHPFTLDNVKQSAKNRGHRGCLACSRASDWSRNHTLDFQLVADVCFTYKMPPSKLHKMGLF